MHLLISWTTQLTSMIFMFIHLPTTCFPCPINLIIHHDRVRSTIKCKRTCILVSWLASHLSHDGAHLYIAWIGLTLMFCFVIFLSFFLLIVCISFQSLQLGCTYSNSKCCRERCDHVYLFDNDYEDARYIYGKHMRGRFPYDDKVRIILENLVNHQFFMDIMDCQRAHICLYASQDVSTSLQCFLEDIVV